MKLYYKILIITIIITALILFLSTITFGTTLDDLDASPSTEFNNAGNAAVKVLTTVGMIVSVVALVLIGIKYMLGSMEQRAEYKRSLIPYVIGAILVFAASVIASIVYNVANDI